MSEYQARFRCFTRTWWTHNAAWPNGLEPCAGKRRYISQAKNLSYDEARRYCQQYNAEHKPGKLSRKCEFEQQ